MMYPAITEKMKEKTTIEQKINEKKKQIGLKQRLPTWFECLQLLVTFCVPITIGIFTLLNNTQQTTLTKTQYESGLENRRTDLKIAADN